MQNVIYANISKADLCYLFGIGETRFRQWVKQGLPCEPDGRFSLCRAIRWREQRRAVGSKLAADRLTQKQLASLFSVSRQTVTVWTRAGMPRCRGGTYRLPSVLVWLRQFYMTSTEKKYRDRLEAMRKKVRRNVRQLERFLAGGKSE